MLLNVLQSNMIHSDVAMPKNDYFSLKNNNYWGLILSIINSTFAFFFAIYTVNDMTE